MEFFSLLTGFIIFILLFGYIIRVFGPNLENPGNSLGPTREVNVTFEKVENYIIVDEIRIISGGRRCVVDVENLVVKVPLNAPILRQEIQQVWEIARQSLPGDDLIIEKLPISKTSVLPYQTDLKEVVLDAELTGYPALRIIISGYYLEFMNLYPITYEGIDFAGFVNYDYDIPSQLLLLIPKRDIFEISLDITTVPDWYQNRVSVKLSNGVVLDMKNLIYSGYEEILSWTCDTFEFELENTTLKPLKCLPTLEFTLQGLMIPTFGWKMKLTFKDLIGIIQNMILDFISQNNDNVPISLGSLIKTEIVDENGNPVVDTHPYVFKTYQLLDYTLPFTIYTDDYSDPVEMITRMLSVKKSQDISLFESYKDIDITLTPSSEFPPEQVIINTKLSELRLGIFVTTLPGTTWTISHVIPELSFIWDDDQFLITYEVEKDPLKTVSQTFKFLDIAESVVGPRAWNVPDELSNVMGQVGNEVAIFKKSNNRLVLGDNLDLILSTTRPFVISRPFNYDWCIDPKTPMNLYIEKETSLRFITAPNEISFQAEYFKDSYINYRGFISNRLNNYITYVLDVNEEIPLKDQITTDSPFVITLAEFDQLFDFMDVSTTYNLDIDPIKTFLIELTFASDSPDPSIIFDSGDVFTLTDGLFRKVFEFEKTTSGVYTYPSQQNVTIQTQEIDLYWPDALPSAMITLSV